MAIIPGGMRNILQPKIEAMKELFFRCFNFIYDIVKKYKKLLYKIKKYVKVNFKGGDENVKTNNSKKS